MQPLLGLQASSVHTLPSSQFGAVPPTQLPAWQLSLPLHWFPSEQAWQLPPALPQADAEVPATQLEPFQQPVQQLPLWHFPPEQEFVLGVCVQLPLLQLSVVQGLPSSQFWHTAPAFPQAASEVPAEHEPALMQPVQQSPPRHEPPKQFEPSGRSRYLQVHTER